MVATNPLETVDVDRRRLLKAAAAGIAVHELTPQQPSLEETFMKLTRDHAEFRAGPASPGQAGPGE